MKKFWKILDTIMDALLTIGMIGLSTLCIAQVFCRFVLKYSIMWANEAACYLFVYVVFIAAFILIRDKGFIRMDLFQSKVPAKGRFIYDLILKLLVICYAIVLVIYGSKFAQNNAIQTSSAMRLPMNIVYSIMPISGCFMILYSLRDIAEHITNHKKNKEADKS